MATSADVMIGTELADGWVDLQRPAALYLGPSVQELVTRLTREQRSLSGEDRQLARAICLEIAERADELLHLPKKTFSRLDGLMDRVHLYQDEVIVIRAHLFHGEASETYVHNHGQAMISTCLEGSYVHQIYEVDRGDELHHFRFRREPNGIYSEHCERLPGGIEEILCQPFQAGQSLFISALAKHKVVGSNQRVTTITIRDAAKRFAHCDILSDSHVVSEPLGSVSPIEDDAECQVARERLRDAVLSYRLINDTLPPADTVFYKNLATQVAKSHNDVRRVLENIQSQLKSSISQQDNGIRQIHQILSTSRNGHPQDQAQQELGLCGLVFMYSMVCNQVQKEQALNLRRHLRPMLRSHRVPSATIERFFDSPNLLSVLPYLPETWGQVLMIQPRGSTDGRRSADIESQDTRPSASVPFPTSESFPSSTFEENVVAGVEVIRNFFESL